MLKLVPVKKTKPRTLTVSPLLTLVRLWRSVPGCQVTLTVVLPDNMAKAESEGRVRVKVAGPAETEPDSPDTVPTSACCCSFTFSATVEVPLKELALSTSTRCPARIVEASNGKFGGDGNPPIPLVSMLPLFTLN